MLDLDHPQTAHVFAAARQEDLILDYASESPSLTQMGAASCWR
jgi:hypothetical protein